MAGQRGTPWDPGQTDVLIGGGGGARGFPRLSNPRIQMELGRVAARGRSAGGTSERFAISPLRQLQADEINLFRSSPEYARISGGGIPQQTRQALSENPSGFARLTSNLEVETREARLIELLRLLAANAGIDMGL